MEADVFSSHRKKYDLPHIYGNEIDPYFEEVDLVG